MKKKNGFTLVELLAVIVILAIILVIAIPQIVKTIDAARLGAFRSTAKLLLSQADKQKLIDETLTLEGTATPKSYTSNSECDALAELNDTDYGTCTITYDTDHYKLSLQGLGKFANYSCTNATSSTVDSACTKSGS